MKKVLASVLAGSMVLGMASMASAATSLVLKKGDTDFNYQLYLYEPAGEYNKNEDEAYKLPAKVQNAYDDFVKEYNIFSRVNTVAGAREYANTKDTKNVFALYTKFYNLAKAEDSLITDGKFIIDDLGLIDPDDIKLVDAATTKASAVAGKDELIAAITDEDELTGAKEAFETAEAASTTTAKNATPTSINKTIKAIFPDGKATIGEGEYPYENKSSVDIVDANDHYMYTYGTDDAKETEFEIVVKHGEDFRVDVASGKVTVSRKRIEADTKNDVDRYLVTIKAAAGVRDFELSDWKVELDLHDANRVYYIEGEVAYSDYRDVLPDERYIITKSNTDDLHNDGCVFNFDEVIDDETRIVCDDYVDLLFKGNYGTDFENLRVMTDDIKEVEDFFQDYDIDYYDFIGTPKFAKDITVRIDADSDAYIYEYDKKTGDVVDITDEAEYTSDGMTFKRKALKTYVVLEEPYEGGNVKAEKEPVAEEEPEDQPEETETPDDSDATGSKPNPGTGAYPLF